MNLMSAARADFVERMGRYWEAAAFSRNAGRILGWLMVCDPDHQSASDLVAALGMSTGSASTQVRHLEQLGLVERVTFPGDRVRYYRIPDRAWSRIMDRELDRIAQLRKLAEEGTQVLPAVRPERVTELKRVTDFIAAEWPDVLDRLKIELERGE